MSTPAAPPSRLLQARQLVRDKGLSRTDLALLEDILRAGEGDLAPLVEAPPTGVPTGLEAPAQAALRRQLGLFLAFLHQFSPRRLGESRAAMGLVLQHSLGRLGTMAEAAHHELLTDLQQPEWVALLLDLLASVRAMSLAPVEDAAHLRQIWGAFLADHHTAFRRVLAAIQATDQGLSTVDRLHAQMKAVNQAIQGRGRLEEALARLAELLEGCIPADVHAPVAPLLLLEHVVSSLRLSLLRPLDRGIHWPAVEQVRGSLRWLWDHLGWSLPRMDGDRLREATPPDLRRLLQQIRRESRPTFAAMARALAGHVALMGLMESLEPLAAAGPRDRYAAVPAFLVLESELGRLADRAYHPSGLEALPPDHEETPRLRGFFRQAVLALRQDQSTLRSLLAQALAGQDADQLALTLDNLRSLLLNHQKQLMGGLVGIFAPDLQTRLFPESPNPMEEGERLRQRLQRLWEQISPVHGQLLLHLELQDWPRLALGLAQAFQQVQAFRRSPEFPLMRRPDREEAERLIQQMGRLLEAPDDVVQALRDGLELLGEFLRFTELFLLRINARIPLIRQDLDVAREALKLTGELRDAAGVEHTRLSHKLIQTAKRLGVRDPQCLALLKKWVRAERAQKEAGPMLDQLASHLGHLALRLEAALG
ncbi:MAG TPA: hypothetical protein VF768_02295 [Holophagaceae bacterium]